MLPKASDFPPGTSFVIKDFDVPLAYIPGRGWTNWFGGKPSPYDASFLNVDNNWPADSFEHWIGLVEASLPATDRVAEPPKKGDAKTDAE